jgi:hypothetical protein
LQPGVAELPLESTTFEPFGVTGDSSDIIGEQQFLFQTDIVAFNHPFLVCKLPTSADGIIEFFWHRDRVDWTWVVFL